MSILRVVIGTLIGAGLLAGLLWLASQFPRVAAFVALWSFGAGLLYLVTDGLRKRTIFARRSRYERDGSPFSYWFYILFYSLLAMLALGCGVYCLLMPRQPG
jgi:hypothetical protein